MAVTHRQSALMLITTMLTAVQDLQGMDVEDHHIAVAAVLQLPHILRNASGRSRKAAVMQHPLAGSLAQAVLGAMPSVELQVYLVSTFFVRK